METSTKEHEVMVKVEPRKEHLWLQKLVGEWEVEGEMAMEIGQPMEKFEGTDTVRSIGDLWIIADGRSPMPDGSPTIVMLTLGFDPDKGRFVGSFVASMMPYLWIYDGELDESERVLKLYTEGPGYGGKMIRFRESIEFIDDDHRVWVSRMEGDDGESHELMRTNYTRKH